MASPTIISLSRPKKVRRPITYAVIEQQDDQLSIEFYGPGWTWLITPDQRHLNAVSKALQYGHYCWSCGDRRWVVCSNSRKGENHSLYMSAQHGPTCDCQGFSFTGCCWHIGALYLWCRRRARHIRLSDLAATPFDLFAGDELRNLSPALAA